jgi:uncharacterized protein
MTRAAKLSSLALWLAALAAPAAEVIPPPPARHFHDAAGLVSAATAERLDRQLADFERTTSSQVLVTVFPKMQSDSALEDYTRRVAESWRVGQRAKNNGAVLFVFRDDRTVRIEVGYGLEGAMPDALAKRIIEDEIVPRFRRGDFEGGLSAGVNAILAATRGEYRGTGRTTAERARARRANWWPVVVIGVFILLSILTQRQRGTVYTGRGARRALGGWGWLSAGGGSRGGWSGGGFRGGGGSFGGGGASGRW